MCRPVYNTYSCITGHAKRLVENGYSTTHTKNHIKTIRKPYRGHDDALAARNEDRTDHSDFPIGDPSTIYGIVMRHIESHDALA